MATSPTRVERFGHVLRALGIRREERMLICLLDTIDWPTAFLGAIKAGVVPVPVNTLLTEDDYRFMLEDSRARLLVVSEELYPKFAKALAACGRTSPMSIVSGANAHGHRAFEDAAGRRRPDPLTAPTVRDDICFWLYTSGSTGKPKAAVHTHADLALTDELYAKPFLGIGENDVCFSVAKLFFAYGLGNALTFPMSAGATTVLLPAAADAGVWSADILKKHQRRPCSTPCRHSTPPCWRARPRRQRGEVEACAAASRPARRCRRRRPALAASATASTFSTASARPRCCTSSSPTAPAT